MLNKRKFDVIISGGGTAGLALALKLAQNDFKVAVIDPAPKPKKTKTLDKNTIGTRTTALMNDNIDFLNSIGIWDSIRPLCEELRTLEIIDVSDKTDKALAFDAEDIELVRYGYNISNSVLLAALRNEALSTKNITLFYKDSIESFNAHDKHIDVELKNAKPISANVLIGADGRNSNVRSLAGITHSQKESGQMALTFHLSAKAHHGYVSTEMHYPGGPYTLVPLPDHNVSLVWVEYQEEAERILSLDKDQLEEKLNEKSKGHLGTLSIIEGPESYPLISLQADSLCAERVALIAEAAHVLHPMGAQGLNTSLRDVQALSNTLVNARNCGQDIGTSPILDGYAKARQSDSSLRNTLSFGLNKMVANQSKPLKFLRRRGLDILSQHSVLRHSIMNYGLAPYKS